MHVTDKYWILTFRKQSMAHKAISTVIVTTIQSDSSLLGKDPQTADAKSLHGDEDEHLNDLH